MKANPENVAKAMTGTLQNEDNERVSSKSILFFNSPSSGLLF